MISWKLNWTFAASMVAISTAIPMARAQDAETTGMVRISDARPRVAAQPASFHGHRSAVVYDGAGYQGAGDQGGVYDGFGDCNSGGCPQGGCQHGHCHGLFRESYGKKSPDYSYSPPAKYPLHRRGVEYNTYFPNQWYGLPGGGLAGGYPMVYQPTDTTQLGFTYQHVPYWQPNRNVMPQRPIPAQWHIVAPPYNTCRFGQSCGFQGGYGYAGGMNSMGDMDQNSVPENVFPGNAPVPGGPTPITPAAPAPLQQTPANQTPVTQAPIPLIPSNPAAGLPRTAQMTQHSTESDHIRRARYQPQLNRN